MTTEPDLVLFPDEGTYTTLGSIVMAAPDLLRGLTAVLHAASADEDRPILHAIAIEPDAMETAYLVAADNYRIAICEVACSLDAVDDWHDPSAVTLEDAKRLILVLKSIPDIKAEGCLAQVTLTLARREMDGAIAGFRIDALVENVAPVARLQLRVVYGMPFPNWRKVLPTETEPVAALNGRYLSEAAKAGGEMAESGIVRQYRGLAGAIVGDPNSRPFVFRSGSLTEIVMPVKVESAEGPALPIRRRDVDPDTGEILGRALEVAAEAFNAAHADDGITATVTRATPTCDVEFCDLPEHGHRKPRKPVTS